MRDAVVYISGKMSGLVDMGRKRFNEAADMLIRGGAIVLNPAALPMKLDYHKCMPICLAMLEAADTVYMLTGWETSEGAKLEHQYALYLNKTIVYEDDLRED